MGSLRIDAHPLEKIGPTKWTGEKGAINLPCLGAERGSAHFSPHMFYCSLLVLLR